MKRTPLKRDPEKTREWQRRSKTLKPGKGLAPGKGPKRTGRVRPVNRERRRKMHERNFGERAQVMRESQCLVHAHGTSTDLAAIPCSGEVQAAHVRARGMGGCNGSRRDLVPLCAAHHRQQHEIGIRSFELLYELDLKEWAARIAADLDGQGIE